MRASHELRTPYYIRNTNTLEGLWGSALIYRTKYRTLKGVAIHCIITKLLQSYCILQSYYTAVVYNIYIIYIK